MSVNYGGISLEELQRLGAAIGQKQNFDTAVGHALSIGGHDYYADEEVRHRYLKSIAQQQANAAALHRAKIASDMRAQAGAMARTKYTQGQTTARQNARETAAEARRAANERAAEERRRKTQEAADARAAKSAASKAASDAAKKMAPKAVADRAEAGAAYERTLPEWEESGFTPDPFKNVRDAAKSIQTGGQNDAIEAVGKGSLLQEKVAAKAAAAAKTDAYRAATAARGDAAAKRGEDANARAAANFAAKPEKDRQAIIAREYRRLSRAYEFAHAAAEQDLRRERAADILNPNKPITPKELKERADAIYKARTRNAPYPDEITADTIAPVLRDQMRVGTEGSGAVGDVGDEELDLQDDGEEEEDGGAGGQGGVGMPATVASTARGGVVEDPLGRVQAAAAAAAAKLRPPEELPEDFGNPPADTYQTVPDTFGGEVDQSTAPQPAKTGLLYNYQAPAPARPEEGPDAATWVGAMNNIEAQFRRGEINEVTRDAMVAQLQRMKPAAPAPETFDKTAAVQQGVEGAVRGAEPLGADEILRRQEAAIDALDVGPDEKNRLKRVAADKMFAMSQSTPAPKVMPKPITREQTVVMSKKIRGETDVDELRRAQKYLASLPPEQVDPGIRAVIERDIHDRLVALGQEAVGGAGGSGM